MSGFKTFPDYVKDSSKAFGYRYIGTNIVLNNPSFPLGFEIINLPTDLYEEKEEEVTQNLKPNNLNPKYLNPNNFKPNNSSTFLRSQQKVEKK